MTPPPRSSSVRLLLFTASMLAVLGANAVAQPPSAVAPPPIGRDTGSEPANANAAQPATQPAETNEAPARKPNRYTSRAYGVSLGPEPPDYVKPLSLYGWPGCYELAGPSGLDGGNDEE